MKRLVYAPRINAYIKADAGIYDISPYIVSGMVNRKSNQVSKASLTFRNPDFMWTKAQIKDATGKFQEGPVFHPQDPIIITMTRLKDRPVQIFTGYCDTTPYLQLFPGICVIEASCTLKRLLYRYFDPGLPFVWQFLSSVGGWQINPQQGGLVNPHAENDLVKGRVHLTDGSIGKLLFSVLEGIGEWDSSNIYIEALPPRIGELVGNLFDTIKKEDETASKEIQDLLRSMLGTDSHGTSVASPANPADTKTSGGALSHVQLEHLWMDAGGAPNIANLMAAVAQAESGGRPNADNSHTGPGGTKLNLQYGSDTVDWGLWSINDVWKNDPVIKRIGWKNRKDPQANAKMAVHVYQVQGRGAWKIDVRTDYQQFLDGKNDTGNPLTPHL